MRFLHLIRPVMCVLPEVASPDRKVRKMSLWCVQMDEWIELPLKGSLETVHLNAHLRTENNKLEKDTVALLWIDRTKKNCWDGMCLKSLPSDSV